jgi:hypothetical protein
MTMIRRLKSYGEEGLYVGVHNLFSEKIILVQEKNLEVILQRERLDKLNNSNLQSTST